MSAEWEESPGSEKLSVPVEGFINQDDFVLEAFEEELNETEGFLAAIEDEVSQEIDDVIKEEKFEETKDRKSLDATQIYLEEIGKAALLSAEQEIHFARLARKGCDKSRHRMIESNLRLVVKIARRYLNRGLPLLDLIEEGNLGLMRAVEKYDPEKGFRFSTYGTWWIRQTIERALMNQTRIIRLPIHVVKELNVYLRASRELTQKLDHEPTPQEIATLVQKEAHIVERILGLNEKVSSLDATVVTETEKSLIDTVADDETNDPAYMLADANFKQEVDKWLCELNEKQQAVIARRFGLRGHEQATLEDVGQEIGLTRERVRQIQVEALHLLKNLLKSKGLSSEILLVS